MMTLEFLAATISYRWKQVAALKKNTGKTPLHQRLIGSSSLRSLTWKNVKIDAVGCAG